MISLIVIEFDPIEIASSLLSTITFRVCYFCCWSSLESFCRFPTSRSWGQQHIQLPGNKYPRFELHQSWYCWETWSVSLTSYFKNTLIIDCILSSSTSIWTNFMINSVGHHMFYSFIYLDPCSYCYLYFICHPIPVSTDVQDQAMIYKKVYDVSSSNLLWLTYIRYIIKFYTSE